MDLLLLAGVFVAVAVATATAVWHLTEPDITRRRLSEVVAGTASSTTPRRESVVTAGPSHSPAACVRSCRSRRRT
ncbi:MAG: hypothetical protein U0P30_16475 [Vicinamibacterales bacterium]